MRSTSQGEQRCFLNDEQTGENVSRITMARRPTDCLQKVVTAGEEREGERRGGTGEIGTRTDKEGGKKRKQRRDYD